MKIAKALFVSPDHNFWYGLVAIAISIFVFAYSTRFGQVSVLVYYALWLPLILIDYRHTLGNYAKFYWIIAFGVLACLSVFWSAAPPVTARAGVQYLSHIACALIAARTMNIRTMSLGVLAGVCLVVLYSLVFGVYHYDPIDGSYSFVGAFASKNLLGFFSSLGIYFAFACLVILRERGVWRLLALVSGGLSAYALMASQSATSIIATAVTLDAMIAAQRDSPCFRRAPGKPFSWSERCWPSHGCSLGLNLGALDAAARRLRQGCHADRADVSLGGRDGGGSRNTRSSGLATRPIGCRVLPKPSGSGRNSTSPRAAVSISTTPISRFSWSLASSAFCWLAWSLSGFPPVIWSGS